MGLFSDYKKKRTPAQIQARLKKRLEKKMALKKLKDQNAALREKLAKS